MSFSKAQKARQTPHRERGQLAGRESLGILEKKSDYKKRAKNFQNKQKQLKELHKKVLEKNPDEFYFKMVNRKSQEGLHWVDNPKPEDTLTPAQKSLLETQNLNYVQWKLQIEKNKIQKIQEKIKLCSKHETNKSKHIFFFESKEEAEQIKSQNAAINNKVLHENEEMLENLTGQLEKRTQRMMELQTVLGKMQSQKILAGDKNSSIRQLVKSEDKKSAAIYKWKAKRNK